MPRRLVVVNTAESGRAALAGIKTQDELISIAGHDVARELGSCKQRANALLFALEDNDLDVVVQRKVNRSPTRNIENIAQAFADTPCKNGGGTAAADDAPMFRRRDAPSPLDSDSPAAPLIATGEGDSHEWSGASHMGEVDVKIF